MIIPDGWKVCALGDVLSREVEPVEVHPGKTYSEIGIRSHGKGIFHKEAVTGQQIGEKRVFRVIPDCLVVNIVFAWEQAIARSTERDNGKIASHRFPMYRPKDGRCDIDFLLYFFKSPRGKTLLELASPGGAGRNKTLGQQEFLKITLPMPAIAEQRRIARILAVWDQAIGTAESLIDKSRAQKKALIQLLLTGGKRLTGFSGKWRAGALRELIDSLDAGVSVNSIEGTRAEGQAVVLKTSCVGDGQFIASEHKLVDPAELGRLKEPLLDDSILISRMNTPALVGASCYVERAAENIYLPDRLWQVKPATKYLCMRWLAYVLASDPYRRKIADIASGTSGSMKNISKADLLNIDIRIPDFEEQKAIAAALAIVDASIESQQGRLEALKREKQALMQQLLTGKRRVKVEQEQSDVMPA